MEEHPYSDVLKLHRRRRCCRPGVLTALLALMMTALWAGLLTLLLLWRWDTVQNLKQLEDTAALNISQVSKDLERYKGDQMAGRSQEAQALQTMEEIQAEQRRMKDQDSELSQDLDGLREDLTNLKSQGLNERRAALTSLEKLQEEVSKLWVELRVANGSMCDTCPEEWVSFQRKCYYFGEGAKRWIQARYACSDLHGRLVSIHSQEEQDFLAKYVNKKGSWIGLRDLNIEGEFVWMDGSTLDYSNWRPGEPNNGGEGEDCVMMLGFGQWNDAFCNTHLEGWMCERLATC
ncbi:low affinity immunoglobulin epsilon Fc receptor isoform X2 [Sturnira hondurensis]|uniref:low affinity immunoglobulin epsilon Fc receptor isoform X2 n=1 Tax=Sturnira hondurensis TaxID=192404 RepID=UPI00187AA7A3|nr:low affinity immunoglobulin epsilon Fc receptor isoform X2 [Sturnira hondurensis]